MNQLILNEVNFPSAVECIYCGSNSKLSDEHILPYGLSGTAIIPKASCGKCARITGRTEAIVQRASGFRELRKFLGLKSRTKHKDCPDTLQLGIIKEGIEQTVTVPIDQYPFLVHFPIFAKPNFFSNSTDKNVGLSLIGLQTFSFGTRPNIVLQNLGASSFQQPNNLNFPAFARMIAKIAYCFAFATNQLDDIEKPSPVISSILQEDDAIGYWVGTVKIGGHPDFNQTTNLPEGDVILHSIEIHHDVEQGLLIGTVQLFSQSNTPTYGVILGKLKS